MDDDGKKKKNKAERDNFIRINNQYVKCGYYFNAEYFLYLDKTEAHINTIQIYVYFANIELNWF